MEKFEITKEQILEIEDCGNYIVTEKLKSMFLDAFKKELEVSTWYKSSNFLIMYKGNNKCISIHKATGDYKDNDIHTEWMHTDCNYAEATEQEIKTALINEAKKRGFVMGCTWDNGIFTAVEGYSFYYNFKYNNLTLQGASVFKNGIWKIADEIVETITKEDAEKLLNKKII